MISEAIAIERFEVNMLEAYAARLAGVLPPWKIVRYLPIERKIRAAIRFSMAKEVPLAK